MANNQRAIKAFLISSEHRVYKDSHYVVNSFYCEDGKVCEFSDNTDTEMPVEKVSTFEELVNGGGKVGMLTMEDYVYRNKRSVGFKSFEL